MVRTILLVDDSPGVVHTVSQILRVIGYRVITANGTGVVSLLREQRPDLLLLDLGISGCDGLELCKQIKEDEALRLTPVLLFSAHWNVACIAQEAGADGYIPKPFKIRDLLTSVATAIEQVQRKDEITTSG